MNVVRMSRAPYFLTDLGVRNQYMVRVINKTNETKTYTITSASEGQTFEMEGNEEGITVPPMGEEVRPVIISVKKEDYTGQFPITLSLIAPNSDQKIVQREAKFLGPNPQLWKANKP